ncbi:hypothetical protein GUJ93_ZPchr0010g7315 [Zizania palustris]|uniref:Uncharacterized protein n=1 Tax=Zizania palustris TaxID=103762 RepID=A0A8J5WAA0_ZIZPA|nr:hypothetical protein GUJ93_ZPchr0010g7315 [Zizania palustris]
MFAAICRRRLFPQIPGSCGGAYRLQYNPGISVLHSHSYSSTAVAGGPCSEPCPGTISYFISCGLSPDAAAKRARKLRIRSTEKADAVCALLRSYGFSDRDMTRLLSSAPLLLNVDPDRITRPKLEFFASIGFESRKLATVPLLLTRSLHNHIIPTIQFLRGVISSDDEIRRAFYRCPPRSHYQPGQQYAPRGGSAPQARPHQWGNLQVLAVQMGVLMLSPRRIGEIFEDLKAAGMSIEDKRFANCFRVICGLKRETWHRKIALYRSFGPSEDVVFEAFKKQPTALLVAEETIKKKVSFFLDVLKLEISAVMAQPVILASSMEKNIMPSAKIFSDKFVWKYAEDVPDVVKAYEG